MEKSGKRVPMTRTASSSSLTSLSAEKTLKSKLLTGITSFLPSKPKVMNGIRFRTIPKLDMY